MKMIDVDFASDFGEEICDILKNLSDIDGCGMHSSRFISSPSGEIVCIIEDRPSFRRTLHFEQAQFSDSVRNNSFYVSFEFSRTASGYQIEFLQDTEDGILSATLDFGSIAVQTELYDYAQALLCVAPDPWDWVSASLAEMSIKKSILGDSYLNQAELEFEPVGKLFPSGIGKKIEKSELFKAVVKNTSCKTTEQLFRAVRSTICDASSEYPTAVALRCDPTEIATARERVVQALHEAGFEGEYPNFLRLAPYPGIHVINIHMQPVITIHEKNMASFISCVEGSSNDLDYDELFHIRFVCGTAFLKSRELADLKAMDAYTCFFPHKNRRRGVVVNNTFYDDHYPAELAIRVAIQTATCEKVSKEDRLKLLSYDPSSIPFSTFALIYSLTGVFFAMVMCLGFAVMALIFCIIIKGDVSNCWDLITSIPWWKYFLFCALGFAVPMSLITYVGIIRNPR